jgi:Flp pilus assembly CpaF family ATPase
VSSPICPQSLSRPTASDLAPAPRPDHLGEVGGAEAFDLLQALNTGHTGTLSTIHANSARMAVERLRTCVATANVGLPDHAIARNIAETIQLVAHIERRNGFRRVAEIVTIDRYLAATDTYSFTEWKEAIHA